MNTIDIIHAMAEAIRQLERVPAGHLYARVMGRLSLQSFDAVISTLIGAELVQRENDLLIWIGPRFPRS